MADEAPANKGRKLTKVTTAYQVQGGAAKDPASVTIWKSGRALTNVDGGNIMVPWAKAAGADPERFQIDFGVDADNKVIGCYIAGPNSPAPTPAKPSGHERTISFHLGSVFEEHPKLRPVGKRQYLVHLEPDADGVMCFMIDLKTGVMKQTGTRGDSADTKGARPQDDAAAGEQ
ncbi:MAG TPA: hypothetical protein VK464_05110 [Symbiobacteriaceae bacterium]|nr:hypothetical protein [Symbiobacteriaceae bacterium]